MLVGRVRWFDSVFEGLCLVRCGFYLVLVELNAGNWCAAWDDLDGGAYVCGADAEVVRRQVPELRTRTQVDVTRSIALGDHVVRCRVVCRLGARIQHRPELHKGTCCDPARPRNLDRRGGHHRAQERRLAGHPLETPNRRRFVGPHVRDPVWVRERLDGDS